jgi:hypothetical protein
MSDFHPWIKYPSVLRERLSVVADIIRRVRSDTVALHEPLNGDNEWCLGCRAYSRTCHAIREASKSHEWLRILSEPANLQFSFAIGEMPFRFYRGRADDPPERYLASTYGEIHHVQAVLDIEGLRPIDKILRLAVETGSTREVSSVTLVEVDEAGNVTETYVVPFADADAGKVSQLQAKAVTLPAPTLEPIDNKEEKEQPNESNERKTGSK